MKVVDESKWVDVVCKLDRNSLVLWVVGGSRLKDVDRVEEYENGLVKVWMVDGSMMNLTLER